MTDKPKFCVECRHVLVVPVGGKPKCKHPLLGVDVVTGDPVCVLAWQERDQYVPFHLMGRPHCGPDARFWEPLPGEDVPVEPPLSEEDLKRGGWWDAVDPDDVRGILAPAPDKPSPREPNPGDLVEFTLGGLWHRGKIVHVFGDTIAVEALEAGGSCMVLAISRASDGWRYL